MALVHVWSFVGVFGMGHGCCLLYYRVDVVEICLGVGIDGMGLDGIRWDE